MSALYISHVNRTQVVLCFLSVMNMEFDAFYLNNRSQTVSLALIFCYTTVIQLGYNVKVDYSEMK